MNKNFFNSLIECLLEEAACYRALTFLGRKQIELLTQDKEEGLWEITDQMQEFIEALNPIIRRKKLIIEKIHSQLGLELKDHMTAIKKTDEVLAEKYYEANEILLASIKDMAVMKTLSEKLIENAVKYKQYTLKLIAQRESEITN
jgi:hypothetical protein